MANVYPVIIIPGITATYLHDEYIIPHETIWSVFSKDYTRLALHPDNVTYEASEPARIRPNQVFEIAYGEMIRELRYNLSEKVDDPVPVYPFSYDWRQPLELLDRQLDSFINEVIERTGLMRNYHQSWFLDNPKVNLVGHSMGGLIIAGYLVRKGTSARVGKVATLATPFRGSFEAVIKIATGTANLGTGAPVSREREAARVTPSLYHLLPVCDGLSVPAGIPADIFDPAIWQPSIVDTLKEYVRLHSVSVDDADVRARQLFASLLTGAKEYLERASTLDLARNNMEAGDWMCVAGVHADTRVGVRVIMENGSPSFDLSGGDRKDLWQDGESSAEKWLTGDGTVPLKSALPVFLSPENLICLTPDDFGYWEIADKTLARAAGFHGILPNMNLVHRLLVRHFTGRSDAYKNTWGYSAPGVSGNNWKPPFPLFRNG